MKYIVFLISYDSYTNTETTKAVFSDEDESKCETYIEEYTMRDIDIAVFIAKGKLP